MPVATLALLLGVLPQFWVAPSSKRPGAEGLRNEVVAAIQKGLETPEPARAPEYAQKSKPQDCNGDLGCLKRGTRSLPPEVVLVAVDVAKIARSVAIHVEAIQAGETVVAALDLGTNPEQWSSDLPPALNRFVADLRAARPVQIAEPERPKETGSPPTADPQVQKKTFASNEIAASSTTPSRAPAWLLTIAGVASGGVSAAFVASALDIRRHADAVTYFNSAGLRGTDLQFSELQRMEGALQVRSVVAGVFGAVAIACIVTAVLLFLR